MQDDSSNVVISVDDLLEHTVLSRKLSETEYKKNYLVRNGAESRDMHIASLDKVIADIRHRLDPINSKLSKVDLITLVPRREEIDSLNAEIEKYQIADIDTAISSRQGALFELLRKRSEITKANYELRDDICRLTILINSIPLEDAESVKAYVEGESPSEISLEGISEEKQQNLLTLLNRLGKPSNIQKGKILPSLGMSCESVFIDGKKAHLPVEKLAKYKEIESEISKLSVKIQVQNAQRQIRTFSQEEASEYSGMQQRFAELLNSKKELLDSTSVNEESVSISAKASS
ncbi:MAG: hypothetical protein WC506_03790 [Candidatus Micrarchaeia archaeon]